MNGLAGRFMKAAVLYALTGFTMGTVMGATQNFAMTSVHSHLNLIGWASMAVYAVFYHLVPSASASGFARAQFWAANAGIIVMSVSLAMLVSGVEAAAPGAGVGSIITLASMVMFAVVVFRSPCLQGRLA